jgi:hypothetical protein
MLLHFTRNTSSDLSIARSQTVALIHDELSVLRVLGGSTCQLATLNPFRKCHAQEGEIQLKDHDLDADVEQVVMRRRPHVLTTLPPQD